MSSDDFNEAAGPEDDGAVGVTPKEGKVELVHHVPGDIIGGQYGCPSGYPGYVLGSYRY